MPDSIAGANPSPMAVQLERLPAEILHIVCSQLCTHCCEAQTGRTDPHNDPAERVEIRLRRSALASLSRTLTLFRAIATPYLYHFVFHQPPEDKGETLTSLLRTIIQRPDLAQAVKHIEVDHVNPGFTVPQDLAEQFYRFAVGPSGLYYPEWSDDPCHRVRAYLELLLLQTPNVQTLHLLVDDDPTSSRIQAIPASFCLSALKTLSVAAHPRVPSRWEDPFHFSARFLLRILPGFPNLTSLRLHRPKGIYYLLPPRFETPSPQGPTPFTSITSLTLSHTDDLHHGVGSAILACDRLEVFKMTFGNKFSHVSGTQGRIVHALQKHKSSLRTFVFGARIFLDLEFIGISTLLKSPVTLRDFTNLRSILVVPFICESSANSTAIVDFLPPSIERLRLLGVSSQQYTTRALWGLHDAFVEGMFPHLEELVVNPGAPVGTAFERFDPEEWRGPKVGTTALYLALEELKSLRFSVRGVKGTVSGLVEPEDVSEACLGTYF